MNQEMIVTVFVELLEEGTPTIRGTRAIDMGDSTYKLLPTENYDPEDEIWEFLPGSIVRCRSGRDNKGNAILIADESTGPVKKVIIYVELKNGKGKLQEVSAVDRGNDTYKILPLPELPNQDQWEYPPRAVVTCRRERNEAGEEILIANRWL